jgi:hypothetical protein
MESLRALNKLNPAVFTTPVLAQRYRISPEAVRRILRCRWEPTRERRIKLAQRDKSLWYEFKREALEKERKESIEARPRKEDEFTFR